MNIAQLRLPGNEDGPIEIDGPVEIQNRFDLDGDGIELAEIITAALPVIYTIAGLILFGMLLWGGYDLLLSGGDKGKAESARGKITTAFIGFFIVIFAFFITRFVLYIFHLE